MVGITLIPCTATSNYATYGFTYAVIAKNTSGTTYGFGVPTGGNGSNTVTQSNVSKITGLTVTTNGFNADFSGISYSFKGNNEYNIGLTAGTNCKVTKDFENMCEKMIGPDKCASTGTSCSPARVSCTCNSSGCSHSYCTTAAFPNLSYLCNFTYYCKGPNGTVYGGSTTGTTGFSKNVCANKAGCRIDGSDCTLLYTKCQVNGTSASTTYSTPTSSCSAIYYP